MSPRTAASLLAGLALLLLFAGLGATALTDRDEGANAEAAREMWERRAWLTPTLNYVPRFAKPAFVYWLMAAAYAVFGVGELAARLPSALATAALVALQYAFARWALGPAAALRPALILLLAAETVVLGRLALTDAVLVLWTTAAGFAFFRAHEGPPPRRRWYAALWAAMALATLTKGPVGALVPAAGIALYVSLTGGWRRLGREVGVAWGVPLFLAIAAPWYAAMFWQHGATYLARAEGETLGRVFRTVTGPGGTVLFYLPVVLLGFFPWSAFLPAALVRTLRRPRAGAAEGRAGAAAVFAASWVVAVLAVFSPFQSRLPHYVAPLFPMAALLVGATWPARVPSVSRALVAGLGLAVAAGLAAAFALDDEIGRLLAPAYPADAGARLPWSVLVVAALALATAGSARLDDGRRLFPTLAVLTAGVLAVGLHIVWPAFNARFVAPAGELVRRIGAAARPCDELVILGPYRPSLVLYAGRRVTFVDRREPDRLGELVARPGRLVVVAPADIAGATPALATFPVLERRGGYVALASVPALGGCS